MKQGIAVLIMLVVIVLIAPLPRIGPFLTLILGLIALSMGISYAQQIRGQERVKSR